MLEKNKKITDNLVLIDPPEALFGVVMNRLERERQLARAKVRLFYFAVVLFFSLAAAWPAVRILQAEFVATGFGQYLALLFYDYHVAAYWQDLGLILLETLPAIGLAVVLAVLLGLLISLRSVIIYGRVIIKLFNSRYYN